jgi:hypothetical protein
VYQVNVLIDVKHKILSFLQTYFANKSTSHAWSSTYSQSKITIADKYAVDLESVEKKPAIIMSRGPTRWSHISIGQRANSELTTYGKTYKDLVRVAFTLNVIGKNGIVLENIAGSIFDILVGYKDTLREVGIHAIEAVEVGEEQVIQSDSEINLTRIPVNVVVSMARTLSKYEDFLYATITISGTTLLEKSEYDLVGQTVIFYTASGEGVQSYSVNYLDAINLASHTEILSPSGLGNYLPLTFQGFLASGASVEALDSGDNSEYTIDGKYLELIENPSDATEFTNICVDMGYEAGLPSGITSDRLRNVYKITYHRDADTPVQRYVLLRSGMVDYTAFTVYGDYYMGNWAYDPDTALSTYETVSGLIGII